jgi:hypothetical protein
MKHTLTTLIRSIVTKEDHVIVEEVDHGDDMYEYVITVAPDEVGKIIGKDGKVIRALRNVMKIPAMKENKRIHLTIAQ